MKILLTLLLLSLSLIARADVPPPPAASQAEVNTGTSANKYVSPKTLLGWAGPGGNGVATTNYVNTATNSLVNALAGYPFMFAVSSNTVTLLTNTDMQVTWLKPVYSTNVNYTTNGGWTLDSDGIYELSGACAFQNPTGTPAVMVMLYLNGARYLVVQENPGQNASIPFTFRLFAHSGDNLKLYVWQNQASAMAGNATPNFQTFVTFTKLR